MLGVEYVGDVVDWYRGDYYYFVLCVGYCYVEVVFVVGLFEYVEVVLEVVLVVVVEGGGEDDYVVFVVLYVFYVFYEYVYVFVVFVVFVFFVVGGVECFVLFGV